MRLVKDKAGVHGRVSAVMVVPPEVKALNFRLSETVWTSLWAPLGVTTPLASEGHTCGK